LSYDKDLARRMRDQLFADEANARPIRDMIFQKDASLEPGQSDLKKSA